MARAATKHEAASIAIGLLGIGVTLYFAAKYGPRAMQALKGTAGSPFAMGGLPGSQASTLTRPSNLAGAGPGGVGSGASGNLNNLANAIKGLFTGGTETVAQALQRGNTSIDQGLLASIFNIQNYGNPYGDSRATTLAAFGQPPNPYDSGLLSLNNAGLQIPQQTTSPFDFGNFGFDVNRTSDWLSSLDTVPYNMTPNDWYLGGTNGPDLSTTDTYTADPGYIDPYQTQNLDLSNVYFDPSSFN